MITKSLGVFKRGKTYWLAWTIAGKQYRESLRTSDEAIAAQRALEWKREPGLLPSRQLVREIASYLTTKGSRGNCAPRRPLPRKSRNAGRHISAAPFRKSPWIILLGADVSLTYVKWAAPTRDDAELPKPESSDEAAQKQAATLAAVLDVPTESGGFA